MRVVFSEPDLEARAWFTQVSARPRVSPSAKTPSATCSRAGWAPNRSSPPSQPARTSTPFRHSGRYDGTVGVLGGLEAIRALQAAASARAAPSSCCSFTSEEPTRFGIGCLGSRLIAGLLDSSAGDTLQDVRGPDARRRARAARVSPADLKPCGRRAVITAPSSNCISSRGRCWSAASPARHGHGHRRAREFRITIEGQGGHAGAVLMPDRHDALLAAAEIALVARKRRARHRLIDTSQPSASAIFFPARSTASPAGSSGGGYPRHRRRPPR